MNVFMAGSRNISRLNDVIRKRIDNIFEKELAIIVGDANGADKAIQSYLFEKNYKNVTIYCSGIKCRNNIGNWETKNIEVPSNLSGLKFYMQKDKEMAEDANYGFMLWDGKSAGTLSNIFELLKRKKTTLVYFSPEKMTYTVSKVDDLDNLINKCDSGLIDKINKKININKSITELTNGIQASLNI